MLVKIIARNGKQISHITNHFMMIGMHPKGSLLQRFTQPEQWLILMTFSLRNNYCSFRGDFFFIEEALHHAVRFEAQGQINFIGRPGLKVSYPNHIRENISKATFTSDLFIY